jgi:hypothetical protein
VAYDAVALVAGQLRQEGAITSFREAHQLRILLSALQNSLTLPCQRLSSSTALFLAEASTAVCNPTSFLFPIVNKLLLRSPTLPLHGLPLFHAMHDGLCPDWRRRRRWARAVALAAPSARSVRSLLAASATLSALSAAPDPSAAGAVGAYLSAVLVESSLPSSVSKIIDTGEVQVVASLAASQLRDVHSASANPDDSANAGRIMNADLALVALLRMAAVPRIWRADMAETSVSHFSIVLRSLLLPLHAVATTSAATAAQFQMVVWRFWKLLEAVIIASRGWQPQRAATLGLRAKFWECAHSLQRALPCRFSHNGGGGLCALCTCLLLTCPIQGLPGGADQPGASECVTSTTSADRLVASLVLDTVSAPVDTLPERAMACACCGGNSLGLAGGSASVRERVLSLLVSAILMGTPLAPGSHSMLQSGGGAFGEPWAPLLSSESCCVLVSELVRMYASSGVRAARPLLLLMLCVGCALGGQVTDDTRGALMKRMGLNGKVPGGVPAMSAAASALASAAAGAQDVAAVVHQTVLDGPHGVGTEIGTLLMGFTLALRRGQMGEVAEWLKEGQISLNAACESTAKWLQVIV